MSSTSVQTVDVINSILQVDETSPIVQLRNQKPTLVDEVQAYYLSLFGPTDASTAAFPVEDRYLVAIRVASHTGSDQVVEWYEDLARSSGVSDNLIGAVRNIHATTFGDDRLTALIRHTDLLSTRPADAQKADLEALKDVGLTPAGIVSLSQTIAFISYQLRLIAGLRAFGGQS
jgi:uncharacterized protein YciW